MMEIRNLQRLIHCGRWDLTEFDLPSQGTRRWTPQMKARVVMGIEQGLVSQAEAIRRYSLSDEEYQLWKTGFAHYGLQGLAVTRLTQLRSRG